MKLTTSAEGKSTHVKPTSTLTQSVRLFMKFISTESAWVLHKYVEHAPDIKWLNVES